MIRKVVVIVAFVLWHGHALAQDAAPEADAAPPDQVERVVVSVPIRGEIGGEVLASGARGALRRASTLGATDIVFLIDSPGGRVADARAIQLVLAEHDPAFEYHAIVSSAISASVWILASCDTIHALPGSRAGGAVVYRQDRSSGSVEVDSKLNSILCAEVAAAAEQKGHPGALFEAMMLMERELLAYDAGDGARVSCARAEAGEGGRVVDNSKTVLTLTSDQMVEFGLARPLEQESLEGLAESLGVGWRELPRVGEAEMRRAANELKRIERELARAIDSASDARQGIGRSVERVAQLRSGAENAVERIPTYSSYSHLRTGDRPRRDAIEYAIARWGDVIAELQTLDRYEGTLAGAQRLVALRSEAEHELRLYDLLESFEAPAPEPAHSVDKDAVYEHARREQARLREMK